MSRAFAPMAAVSRLPHQPHSSHPAARSAPFHGEQPTSTVLQARHGGQPSTSRRAASHPVVASSSESPGATAKAITFRAPGAARATLPAAPLPPLRRRSTLATSPAAAPGSTAVLDAPILPSLLGGLDGAPLSPQTFSFPTAGAASFLAAQVRERRHQLAKQEALAAAAADLVGRDALLLVAAHALQATAALAARATKAEAELEHLRDLYLMVGNQYVHARARAESLQDENEVLENFRNRMTAANITPADFAAACARAQGAEARAAAAERTARTAQAEAAAARAEAAEAKSHQLALRVEAASLRKQLGAAQQALLQAVALCQARDLARILAGAGAGRAAAV